MVVECVHEKVGKDQVCVNMLRERLQQRTTFLKSHPHFHLLLSIDDGRFGSPLDVLW
jgi:hypothetical protein